MPRARKPLNPERLEALALHYAGRYATTRARLRTYLQRKLGERGWDGEEAPKIEPLVERFSELGYVDDAAYARMKARDLSQRGYGQQRIDQALYQAGIARDQVDQWQDSDTVIMDENAALAAAWRFARRKRVGPFADPPLDRERREKALRAMIRAGHDFAVALTVLDAPAPPECGEFPDM